MNFNYITYDSWWDTDITVIPQLSKVFKVNVFCLDPSDNQKYPCKSVPDNVKLVQYSQKYRDRDPRSFFKALIFFYKSFLKNNKKDSVFFFIPGKNPWLLLLMLIFLPKRRTIISTHNYLEHGDINNIGSSFMDKIKRKFYYKFNFFHFFSNYQNELFKKDFPNKFSFTTNMPVKNYGRATPKQRQDSAIHLLFFGLIRDYKRLDWLINAVKAINTKNIKVVIAGNASKEDIVKYKKMIGSNKSFETHFGFVRNEDIPQYFVDTDFLVLPYASATQSGPSLIAINYGIPIIASKIPTFQDLIRDGRNGLLFQKDSFKDFKELIERVSLMSEEKIAEMKKDQLEFKNRYSKSSNISKAFSDFVNNNIKR